MKVQPARCAFLERFITFQFPGRDDRAGSNMINRVVHMMRWITAFPPSPRVVAAEYHSIQASADGDVAMLNGPPSTFLLISHARCRPGGLVFVRDARRHRRCETGSSTLRGARNGIGSFTFCS
jgi:hypothetical protein